jgi:hypothetical protein
MRDGMLRGPTMVTDEWEIEDSFYFRLSSWFILILTSRMESEPIPMISAEPSKSRREAYIEKDRLQACEQSSMVLAHDAV